MEDAVMPDFSRYDVIVIGGGPAGIPAAVQAARIGARTLLIEKSGLLGGATTLNGVNLPGLFHAWGKQIIAGIGWELVTKAVKEAAGTLPDFSTWKNVPHWRLQIPINVPIYAALADRMVISAGVELLFHTMPAQIEPTNNGWMVTLCLKEGLRKVHTSMLIDCSGDANAVRLAGLPLQRSADCQPGTLILRVGGYEMNRLDFGALEVALEKAILCGELERSDFSTVYDFLLSRGNNKMHIPGIDAETSGGKTQAELLARETMLRMVRFLQRQPGLENLFIEQMAPECGIRETASIMGETKITHADYTSGRIWKDSVCYSFYPIDLHRSDGVGIDIRPLREGVYPTIPLSALLPRNSRNLLVAGRSACGDREAQSAFRVQASAMAMGQAAGAAAALAAASGQEVRSIPLPQLRETLSHHGAIVPPSKE